MKHLKSCLPKGSLFDTTISLIPILFIEIGVLYWWNSYSWISVQSDFIIYYPFLYIMVLNLLQSF